MIPASLTAHAPRNGLPTLVGKTLGHYEILEPLGAGGRPRLLNVFAGILILLAVPLSQRDAQPSLAEFGLSVAATPGRIFVAANLRQGDERGPGTVHVFERRGSGWVETSVLSVPEVTVEDLFAVSMAADGDTLVVGAEFADAHGEDAGLAYVFERDEGEWRRVVLSASDAEPGDQFGQTVSISGNNIVVGSRLEDTGGRDSGAAYVFERSDSGWVEVAKLMASDPKRQDLFGRASISGNHMVVSADLNDDLGSAAGKAYAFELRAGAWVEVGELLASDGVEGDELGISLALQSGTSVFGALGSDINGRESGAAYVFERGDVAWSQTKRLAPSDPASQQRFGTAVAVDEDTIAVGAPGDPFDGDASGATYIFERREGSWIETRKLTASDAALGTGFGGTVAVSGGTVVVGGLFAGEEGRRGSAYVFERRGTAWVEVARLQPAGR